MIVELSKPELDLLDEALKSWASAPMIEGMGFSMLTRMMIPREERDPKDMEKSIAEATAKCKARERQALMLRAKLAQAEAKESEHQT
jgi:hypothetical protein